MRRVEDASRGGSGGGRYNSRDTRKPNGHSIGYSSHRGICADRQDYSFALESRTMNGGNEQEGLLSKWSWCC